MLYYHSLQKQRLACLAGWWSGISSAQLWMEHDKRQSFDALYPDPFGPIEEKPPIEQHIQMMRERGEGGPPEK